MSEYAVHGAKVNVPPAARQWPLWIAAEDPSQESIDSAVQALIEVEKGKYPVPMRSDEARALLCVVQYASSLASRHILGEA